MPAFTVFAILLFTSIAAAAPNTYAVSARLQSGALEGSVVYDGNTFVSASISAPGTGTGPYTTQITFACSNLDCALGSTGLGFADAAGHVLFLNFPTPRPGSLAGFASAGLIPN